MFAKLVTIILILLGQTSYLGEVKDYLSSILVNYLPQENFVVSENVADFDPVRSPDIGVAPAKNSDSDEISLSAKAAYVMDESTKQILFAKSENDQRSVASLVKLMTSNLAIKRNSMDEQASTSVAASNQEPSKIDLSAGEVFSVRDLLDATLIKSANDAAYALGEYTGKGSAESFVAMMNDEARFLGLENTFYVNPNGLDNKDQKSSAKDVAIVLSYLARNYLFKEISVTKEKTIQSDSGGRSVALKNTNELLKESKFKIVAGKTGYTDMAGESLAVVAEIEPGRNVVAVILGSDNRFAEMERLLSYIKDNWSFK